MPGRGIVGKNWSAQSKTTVRSKRVFSIKVSQWHVFCFISYVRPHMMSWPLSRSFFLLCVAKGVFLPIPPHCGYFIPSHFIVVMLFTFLCSNMSLDLYILLWYKINLISVDNSIIIYKIQFFLQTRLTLKTHDKELVLQPTTINHYFFNRKIFAVQFLPLIFANCFTLLKYQYYSLRQKFLDFYNKLDFNNWSNTDFHS